MAHAVLSDFVKDALASGKSRKEIADALSSAGWSKDNIEEALAAYADIDFPVPVPRPQAYGSAREAFLYIVYFALLGMVALYIGRLSFAWIDYHFSDDLAVQSWRGSLSGLRWGIASLVVGYPIFIFLGWRLGVRRREDPDRRQSRVRAWLTYVTLIFAAIALIGDFVAVVYQFLSGGLGVRFVLKAIVVAVISGAILWNYSRDAERTAARADLAGRALAAVATIFTAALLVWAFSIVKSPQTARAGVADERRVTDLGVIVRLIDCHRSYFGETPADLPALQERLSSRVASGPVAPGCQEKPPVDPRSGEPYVYAPESGDDYRLCATFERGWPGDDAAELQARRRQLGYFPADRDERRYLDLPERGGEACFTFTAQSFLSDGETTEVE